MKEIIVEILKEYLPTLISYVLMILVAFVANKAKKYINTDIKRSVVKDTVRYIEQVFKDIHGAEKLGAAKAKAVELLTAKGVKISDEELTVLIESAVEQMNRNGVTIDAVLNGNISLPDKPTGGDV